MSDILGHCDDCESDLVPAVNVTTVFQYLICLRCPKVFKDYDFDGTINPIIA